MPSTRFRLSTILKGLLPVILVALVVVVLDQWTKTLVEQAIPKYTSIAPIPALDGYLLFEHVENYGAAFGILQNQGDFFVLVAGVVTVVILYYAGFQLPPQQRFVRILMGLILGGALGNVIDRITQGYVTDFIKIGIPGVYYWPNFNIADSAVVSGTILLAATILWQDIRQHRARKTQAQENRESPAETRAEGIG